MTKTWKMLWPAILAICAVSFGYSATDDNDYHSTDTYKSSDEKYDQGHAATEKQLIGGYNMPARIDIAGAWDFYINASFIYWQALTHDTYFGTLYNYDVNNVPVQELPLIIDFDYDYHPGFKVGLGMNSSYDNWNTSLQYTRFYMSEKGSSINNYENTTLYPAWECNRLNPANYIDYAKWKLMMNVVDLALGRPYYVGTKLIFHPFVGAKAFWNYQRYHTSTAGDDIYSTNIITKNNSWALGTRAGINTSWIFGEGFSLFSNLAFSLNYQHYRMHAYTYRNDWLNHEDLIGEPINNHRNSRAALAPVAEMMLGFAWGTYFDNCNWHINFSAAYEFQMWWNQNTLMAYRRVDFRPTNNIYNSCPYDPTPLMLHGLTVSAKLDF